MKYYPDSQDDWWNQECEKLIPYLSGIGIDIGSGARVIFENMTRVDIDKDTNPDYCCSGDDIPIEDESFDYLTSIHNLEHFEDTEKALREFRRVIKKGGIVAVVHPDVDHTGILRPNGLLPGENPYNEHKQERSYKGFIKWFNSLENIGLKIIDSGEAREKWSFYVIFKRVIAFK